MTIDPDAIPDENGITNWTRRSYNETASQACPHGPCEPIEGYGKIDFEDPNHKIRPTFRVVCSKCNIEAEDEFAGDRCPCCKMKWEHD